MKRKKRNAVEWAMHYRQIMRLSEHLLETTVCQSVNTLLKSQ